MKYRTIPTIIEAMQWTGDNIADIRKFLGKQFVDEIEGKDNNNFVLMTSYGCTTRVPKSNFIIKNEDKEFYSCNPDVFNKKYEVCKVEE